MLDAVAEVVNDKGYVAMSVEDIITVAGVSRRTFYDNFKSKEDAYLASYDAIAKELMTQVTAAYGASKDFMEGAVACMRAFLELAAAEPRYANMCIVEVLAAGPAAIARRNAIMHALAEVVNQGARTLPQTLDPPPLTAEIVIGGVYEVVYSRVLAGEATHLPALLPDLAYSIMLPYIGTAAAERALVELRGAAPQAAG
jgi:AcrR family transcriptional regulator